MFSLQTIESEISAVMETLVKAAVTELGTILARCSAPALTNEEGAREATPPEMNEAMTKQFASLMEAWARTAVGEMLLMVKVSMCESEDGPAAEQRADRTKQKSLNLTAGGKAGLKKQSASGRSSQKEKNIEGGLKPVLRKDHIHYQADGSAHERNSPSEPEGSVTEPVSELVSVGSGEDVIQGRADTSAATLKIKKNKSSGSFRCPSCDKSFALKCLLDRHYLTHSKPHLCSECGKRFAGLPGLIAHSRRHSGEKLYKCSDCGTDFAYKSTLDRHMRRHGLQKAATHMCTLCEKQFSGLLALQRHRCCALIKTFVCSLCPETFDCRQSLADHENLHTGDRDFTCEICGESFFSSSSLATHRVTHAQKESCCDLLGLGSSDPSVLRNHLSKHTGEKLFSCDVCGKGCSHRSALKHHMLTHTGERPYVCDTCGKRCSHASALQNHMRVHTGRKAGQQPVCSVCGKTFRRMVNLTYHMSSHTGVKPYACDQCDKKFTNPSNLKLHTLSHAGEKMYGCNICGRRFTQSGSLKLHRRIHTGERPYRCTRCGKGFMYSSEFRKHQRSHPSDGEESSEKDRTAKI